jgi:hypothetical protein
MFARACFGASISSFDAAYPENVILGEGRTLSTKEDIMRWEWYKHPSTVTPFGNATQCCRPGPLILTEVFLSYFCQMLCYYFKGGLNRFLPNS